MRLVAAEYLTPASDALLLGRKTYEGFGNASMRIANGRSRKS